MKVVDQNPDEILSYVIEKWLAKSIIKFTKVTPLTKEEIETMNKFITFINGEIQEITEVANALEQEDES